MAKVPAHPSRFWLNEYALAGYLTSGEMNVDQATPPVTTFLDAGPRRIIDNYDHNHSFQGLFDPVDDQVDEQIFAKLGSADDHYLAEAFGAAADGDVIYEAIVRLAGQPRSAQVGGAILLNFEAVGSGGLARSQIIRTASITGTGAGTGRNFGVTAANTTFQAVVRAISGTFTSITVDIQESQNDGSPDTYANIAGMSATLSAAGVSRLTTVAATEAWKRINVSAFSGTSVVLLVTAGKVLGT